MKRIEPWILAAAIAALLFAAACLTTGPQTGVEGQPAPAAPATSAAPANPELKILKVSGLGAGQTGAFAVKLQWNGDKPADWTIKKWTMMRDKTDQTQSLLVIEDQTFSVQPGEPRILQVKALPINPGKEPPRNLIVEYAGMPVYELTDQIADPKVKAVQGAIDKVNQALVEIMPLIKISRDSITYSPKDRGKIEPYLDVAVWDLSSNPPRPYVEQAVIEGAFVVAFAGGMSVREYSGAIQKRGVGIAEKDATREANRLAPRVNRLLSIAGLDARLTK